MNEAIQHGMNDEPVTDKLSREELQLWTDLYASDSSTDVADQGDELIILRLGEERFALPMNALDEVAVIADGAALPNVPRVVSGITNLRGEVLLLLDLGLLLGVTSSTQLGPENRTLIIRDPDGMRTGFMVDALERVLSELELRLRSLDEGHIQHGASDLIEAVGEHDGSAIALLNVNNLMNSIQNHLK